MKKSYEVWVEHGDGCWFQASLETERKETVSVFVDKNIAIKLAQGVALDKTGSVKRACVIERRLVIEFRGNPKSELKLVRDGEEKENGSGSVPGPDPAV